MAELRVKSTGTLKLFENDNTSSVTIASPASLGADRTVTLPDADVTLASGTMLATDGDGSSLTGLPDSTPAFSAKLSGDKGTYTEHTTTKVAFDEEVFDSDGTYDHVTNYRFTPAVVGKYLITAGINFASAADGRAVKLALYFNGGSLYQNGYFLSSTYYQYNQANAPSIAAIVNMDADDYVEIYGMMYSGTNYTFKSDTSYFQGFRLIGV